MSTESKAVHALLLIFAESDSLKSLAKQIMKEVNVAFSDVDNTQVLRADVTDGPFNIILQVSSENDEVLKAMVTHAVKFEGVKQLLVARVLEHIPELDAVEDTIDTTDLSFGENAWG